MNNEEINNKYLVFSCCMFISFCRNWCKCRCFSVDGFFSASGTEFPTSTTKKDTDSEHGAVAWGSVFLEGVLNDRFMVGIDYVPTALETDTVETAKSD
jgi:hypothetical protein